MLRLIVAHPSEYRAGGPITKTVGEDVSETQGQAPSHLQTLLASLPSDLDGGHDLSALPEAQQVFEEARAVLEGPAARLADAAGACCEWLILAEGEEAQRGRILLQQARELLLAHAADEALPNEIEALNAQFAALLGLEQSPAPSPEADKPAPDRIQIRSEEDAVVYREFISEADEHIEQIELRVLDLEQSPRDVDIINDIFRPIHSMKGAAGFLGLATTNKLCHELETLLDRGRKLTLTINRPAIDVVLSGIDRLKQLLENIRTCLAQQEEGAPPTDLPEVDIRPVVAAVQAVLDQPADLTPGAADAPDIQRIGGRLVAAGLITEAQLREALAEQQRPLGRILAERGAISQQEADQTVTAPQPQTQRPRSTAIKVETGRLDRLMEMVGELVIAQSQVAQDELLQRDGSETLTRNVGNLSKISRNLQDLVMSMRMVPLRQTFQRMLRLVRDTAQKTGKEAGLQISGEETEIDKTVIEEIADPLVHLLRNAVDHGLEPPDVREQAGKPREGTVQLRAFHHGGNVVIEVEDDGRGLNRERILAKAVERGVADPGRDYSDSEVFSFVMAAGFSTTEEATDISGRGVGMDVVKGNIEKLGGRVELSSREGSGTTVTIRLPLTMAIVDGMIVAVGDERYVVPLLSIDTTVRPRTEDVSTLQGRGEVILVRDELVPLLRLGRVFGQEEPDVPVWDRLALVVTAEDRRVALLVDELLGQQQVVIKSLGERLQDIEGVSGGCILGDGRVSLILDVAQLLELAER
jgi:two-component system chemotaxis sensor kinase CheA